jgi:hypothetical protein
MPEKPPRHVLSKSTFLRGCQCPKSLYLYKYEPKLRSAITEPQQAIFDRGTSVGELARQLFPGGTDASPESPYKYQESVVLTKELIKQGVTILYEAAFQYDGVLAAIDILVKKNGKWRAYEVKSSTEVKDVNILDASLQYYVITKAGVKLSDISIVHLNNEYVRKGRLKLNQLFTEESVYDEVRENQPFVAEKIDELKRVIKMKSVPDIGIGPHCMDPYGCDFMEHCWSHVPEPSVFDIANLRMNKKFELYGQGIVTFKQVERQGVLNERQQQQVTFHLKKKSHIDKAGLKEFLKSLAYPLSFLDFETFGPAVPLYDWSRPYQQIPFQYSLHCLAKKNASLQHHEFLAEPNGDPRIPFMENLLAQLTSAGDILTYNQSFEISRLNELAEVFPKYAKHLHRVTARIKDLMAPFRDRLYYTHTMQGSYSIKAVLPALVPDLSYDSLAIGNGNDASLAFERMVLDPAGDHVALRKALLEYCGLDTLGMVKVLGVLEGV